MLARLEIRDFALIREAHLDLAPGFNVLTGATGVGKTLVLAALDLLLGGRARADRLGADGSASVAGLFHLEDGIAGEIESLGDCGVHEGEVLVRRTAEAGGRNRCSVNGTMATVATLRSLGERLVDIHGQNEHQSLLRPAAQLEVLDRFAGLTESRDAFAGLRAALAEAVDRLTELERDRDERASRLDYLDHVVTEIVDSAPKAGEIEDLERTGRRLREVERYREALVTSCDRLYECDGAIASEIAGVVRRLQDVADLDEGVAAIVDALEEARVGVEEAAFALRERTREADEDPARLDEVETRLDLLHDLCRKHGPTEEDVLRTVDEASEEIQRLQHDEMDHTGLAARIEELREGLVAAGESLVSARLEAGGHLADGVAGELADLGMEGARIEIVHVPPPAGSDVLEGSTSSGPGRFEIRVATNPGAEPMPLQRIASGGEVARIMLALKSRLAQADRIPVIVFDEVDTNVGGRLRTVLGAKISALARHRQVLCVTHLPQIAAFADRHLRVTKAQGADDTVTSVSVLSDEERLAELAEMLGGDAGAETALAQARALLGDAKSARERTAP
jgi:DNA repair protein RecN (Recombination protein N)